MNNRQVARQIMQKVANRRRGSNHIDGILKEAYLQGISDGMEKESFRSFLHGAREGGGLTKELTFNPFGTIGTTMPYYRDNRDNPNHPWFKIRNRPAPSQRPSPVSPGFGGTKPNWQGPGIFGGTGGMSRSPNQRPSLGDTLRGAWDNLWGRRSGPLERLDSTRQRYEESVRKGAEWRERLLG